MTNLIWSFAPWGVFIVVNRFANLYVSILVAAIVALIVLGRSIGRKHVHVLDIVSPAYFVVLGLVLVAVRPDDIKTWARYAQAGGHGLLTVVVLGSILFGHPFTESYAREQVPESYWHSTQFHEVNRRLSLVWGLAFLVGTASLVAAGSESSRQFILRILVPFGALALAFMYTQKHSGGSGTSENSASESGAPGRTGPVPEGPPR